jgi:hypothetical protein
MYIIYIHAKLCIHPGLDPSILGTVLISLAVT